MLDRSPLKVVQVTGGKGKGGQCVLQLARSRKAPVPVELGYLPGKDLVDGTARYLADSLLGYGFLPRGLQAEYRLRGKRAVLFIAFCSSAREAGESLGRYGEQMERTAQGLTPEARMPEDTLLGEDRYYGTVLVTRYESFLIGAVGLQDTGEGVSLVRAARQRIEAVQGKL